MKLKFKEFILTQESNHNEQMNQIFAALTQLCAKRPTLPKPTTFIDYGGRGDDTGFVWNTTDINMVVRAGPEDASQSEETMADEELQETGGVARIHQMKQMLVGERQFLVTWKEKVDTNVEGFLLRSHKDQYENIGRILATLYHVNREGLQILNRFPPTQGLCKAIMRGLPVGDLALESNLGVTKDGRIVAFDC